MHLKKNKFLKIILQPLLKNRMYRFGRIHLDIQNVNATWKNSYTREI